MHSYAETLKMHYLDVKTDIPLGYVLYCFSIQMGCYEWIIFLFSPKWREKKNGKSIAFTYPQQCFRAQRLVGTSKELKQVIQIEHNIAKNPNWSESNQLVIYKHDRRFELGAAVKQIQVVVGVRLKLGTPWSLSHAASIINVFLMLMLMSSENRRNVSTNTSVRYSTIHRTLGTRLTVENKMAD